MSIFNYYSSTTFFFFSAQISTPVIKNVATYTDIITFQFPSTRLLPAIVDDIIEGNLANVDISKNFSVFIGNNPPMYVNKSFGVPGIKNKMNKVISIYLVTLNHFEFSIFYIFSLEIKL